MAPKGVPKDDPNIDLLKLRSIAVSKWCVFSFSSLPNQQAPF